MKTFFQLTRLTLTTVAALTLFAASARAHGFMPVPDETPSGRLADLLAQGSGTVWLTGENGSRYQQAGYWAYDASYSTLYFQITDGRIVYIDLLNSVEPGCLDFGTATYGWVMTNGTTENLRVAEGTIIFQSAYVAPNDGGCWGTGGCLDGGCWGTSGCWDGGCVQFPAPAAVDAVLTWYQDGASASTRLTFMGY